MSSRTSRSAAVAIVVLAALSCEPGARFVGPEFVGSPNASSAATSGTIEVWIAANPSGQDPTLLTRTQPSTLIVDYFGLVRLQARIANSAGRTIPSSITYTSGNQTIATVSGTGDVQGVAYGQTTVTVSSGTLSRVIPVIVGEIPFTKVPTGVYGVAVSSSGVVYAASSDQRRLFRTNLPSTAFTDGQVQTTSGAEDVLFNSTGSRAYPTYWTSDGVGVIDVATNIEVARVPEPARAFRAVISNDDQKLYAIDVNSPNVWVIDAVTNAVLRTIPLGGIPEALAWRRDGTRLYVCWGNPAATITEIDPVTDTPIRSFAVGGESYSIATSLDGSRLFVANYAPPAYSLDVWSIASGSQVASVALPDTSLEVRVSPDGTRIWVVVHYQGKVLVFDSQSLQLVATLKVGAVPYRVAFDPRGSTAAISNVGGNITGAVSFVRTGPFQSPEDDPQLRVGVAVGGGFWRPNAPGGLVIPTAIALDVGATAQLSANMVNPAGWAFSDPATYSTTTPSIVAVDASGLVTGLRGGVGSVTVTIGSQTTTVPITVYGHPIPQLSATTTLPDRTYGTAVSTQGVFMATRFNAGLVAKGTLPGTAIESNVAVGTNPATVAFNAAGTTAYVTNQVSGTLSIIDVATGAQLSEMRLEGSASGSAQGGTDASPPATDSALSAALSHRAEVPDAGTLASPVPLFGNPFGVTVSPDDAKVYVGIISSNIVQVVDPAVPEVVRNITLGGFGPTSFAWSQDGTRLYVNSTNSGVITEINATTDVVTRTFSTGGRPQGMAVSRDGAELYVADENRQMLDVWRLSDLTRIASTPLGAGGLELGLTPDNARIWISMKTQGRVLVIDRATRQVLQPVSTGGRPRQIAFDLFGTTGVVANDQANALHFIR